MQYIHDFFRKCFESIRCTFTHHCFVLSNVDPVRYYQHILIRRPFRTLKNILNDLFVIYSTTRSPVALRQYVGLKCYSDGKKYIQTREIPFSRPFVEGGGQSKLITKTRIFPKNAGGTMTLWRNNLLRPVVNLNNDMFSRSHLDL